MQTWLVPRTRSSHQRSPQGCANFGIGTLAALRMACPDAIDFPFAFCSYRANRCNVVAMPDPLTLALVAGLVLAGIAAVAALMMVVLRARRREPTADPQLLELARLQAQTTVRIDAMREMLAARQAELQRAVNERLDSVTHHLNQSMTTTRQHTVESLQRLNERLAVIDNAQRNITDLASQVTSLQSVLANKQQRGAFG